MGRSPCCDKNGLKKGPWTPEEDHKLTEYIQKHGYGNWRTLPKNAGLQRCGKSCRLRWTNYLRPDIKRGRFSFEEEETIIQLHSILGNKWSAIATRLPGRTDNEIKNYWNTHVRKRLLRMGIDPVTHSPRLDLLDLSSILTSSFHINPSQYNFQPFINPQLLKLATSFISSQRQNQNQVFLASQESNDNNNNPLMQNNDYQQQQLIQPNNQLEENPTTFENDKQELIMEPTLEQIQSSFNTTDDHQDSYYNNLNEWLQSSSMSLNEDNYVEMPNFSDYNIMDFDNNNNNSNLCYNNQSFNNFQLSASSSPTPLNSINSSSTTTEDEREISYCSNNMYSTFDIFNVNEF
ncbi:hypothetical protein ACFE04_019919 [Oxalis oulophora]